MGKINTDSLGVETWQFALETLRDTKDFVVSEAPILVQELYTYQIIKSSMLIFLSALVILHFLKKRKDYRKNDWYRKETCGGYRREFTIKTTGALLHIFITSFFTIMLIVRIHVLVKILVAPRLYLIDYITSKVFLHNL